MLTRSIFFFTFFIHRSTIIKVYANFYSRRKFSNLACKSASASRFAASSVPAAVATGCFEPVTLSVPEAFGKPDSWSVNCKPSSSRTCDTMASLNKQYKAIKNN